jgi:HAD superfamily hydrolase (TIGR01549 family)
LIDTITFDLWNTLISNTPQDALRFQDARSEGIIEAFLTHGIKMEKEKVEKALDLTFKRCWDFWERNIDFDSEDQIKMLMEFLPDFDGTPCSDLLKRIERAYTKAVLQSPPDLIEGSFEILGFLKNRKHKLGLICNTGRSPGVVLRKLLAHYQISEYFDDLTFSNELKIRKPDPQIFLFTLERLKSKPSHSIHVGDELKTDVKGSKSAGMIAVHFDKSCDPYQEIQPDYRVEKLKEIKRIVEELEGT